jgi:hypothetical protein
MRALLFLLIASKSSCEPATAKQPLNPPESLANDSAFMGTWLGSNREGDSTLTVVPHASGKQFDLVLVAGDKAGAHVLHYQGHFAKERMMSLRAKKFADPIKDAFTLAPKWIFAKYDLNADGSMTLSWLEQPEGGKDLQNAVAYIASPGASWLPFEIAFRRIAGESSKP